jgi:hypothetical protein
MRYSAYSRVLDTGENTVLPQNLHRMSVESHDRISVKKFVVLVKNSEDNMRFEVLMVLSISLWSRVVCVW